MAEGEAELRARLADIERHLTEMPPHNASGSRDELERQRVDLQRRLSERAKPAKASPPAPTGEDPRVGRPQAPASGTPELVDGGFRRTTHVACGPAAGTDYGDGVEVARELHARCRDVRRQGDGTTTLDEASILGHLDAQRVMTDLHLDDGPTPPGLVGQPALPGLRRLVTDAIDDVTTARAVVLLDLGIGGTLAAYGRMQAGRQAGKSSAQVMRANAVDLLGDSCRGWANDGQVVANVLAGTHRPAVLPPEVPTDDLDAWHDLGPLAPWWIRRRRRIDVTGADGEARRIVAAFRDSWVDAEGTERSLHEWELDLDLDGDAHITRAEATARSLPFNSCPTVATELSRLVGTSLDDLRRNTRDVLGGTLGCTHLNDLLTTIPAAVTAAGRTAETP